MKFINKFFALMGISFVLLIAYLATNIYSPLTEKQTSEGNISVAIADTLNLDSEDFYPYALIASSGNWYSKIDTAHGTLADTFLFFNETGHSNHWFVYGRKQYDKRTGQLKIYNIDIEDTLRYRFRTTDDYVPLHPGDKIEFNPGVFDSLFFTCATNDTVAFRLLFSVPEFIDRTNGER